MTGRLFKLKRELQMRCARPGLSSECGLMLVCLISAQLSSSRTCHVHLRACSEKRCCGCVSARSKIPVIPTERLRRNYVYVTVLPLLS